MKLERFIITKNRFKDAGNPADENKPDYRVAFGETEGKLTNVGACWLKTGKSGEKYFSCSIDRNFTASVERVEEQPAAEDFSPF